MTSVILICFLFSIICSTVLFAQPIPSEVAKGEKFVEGLQDAIEAGDKKKISDFFEDDFTFKGCTRDFTKTDAINLILAMGPQMTGVVQNQTQITYHGSLKFITTTKFVPMIAEFRVSPNWRLATGNSLSCEKTT